MVLKNEKSEMMAQIQTEHFLRTILDALPTPVFVIDETMTVMDMNTAARKFYKAEVRTRAGKILHCIHTEKDLVKCGTPGCCNDCIIQNATQAAISGHGIMRRKSHMQIMQNGETKDVHLLVTTTPVDHQGQKLALLILEDMTEITELKALLPICASCKKIRNDEDYWEHVEDYLHRCLDIDFTHGICPACIKRLYPQIENNNPAL